MNSTDQAKQGCLVHLVADEMSGDPTLEAVRVDRAAGALSVATMGNPGNGAVADRLAERLRSVHAKLQGAGCSLLTGAEDCAQCPHSGGLPDGRKFTIEHQPGVTTIARVTCPTAPRFWRWRDHPLPRFVPREVRLPEDEHEENEWKAQLAGAGVCLVAGLIGWGVGAHPAGLVLFALSYIAGAWFPAIEVWERLQERRLDVHFLMLAVAAGAASIGAWEEGATLLFLFSFSGALEHYAMGRTHREIRSLIRTAPKHATLLDEHGVEHRTSVDSLAAGMRLVVKPGELFPVDAEITRGSSAADESNLTGEAVPVDKGIGDTVLGGTLNLWGVVEATVTRPAAQSSLQRIIHLIHESQHMKAPSQRLTDRFGTGYTLAALGFTVAMFFIWWALLGRPAFASTADRSSAFYLAMTLLVVASPCALVLSIPSAILAAIARGARQGILFRGGAAVEKLAEIDLVAMDKTGTLTTGELRVDRVESFPPGQESRIATIAYALERHSLHPLARAVARHGKQERLPALEVEGFESVNGLGLRGVVDGQPAILGRREFVLPADLGSELALQSVEEPGISEVWVRQDSCVGRLLLRDDIRPQAREVVARLRALNLATLVLTGDREATGRHLQQELNPDEVRTGLKPEEKVASITTMARAGRRVAMIGDGVNDAPALAAAHVGVAMGARGSDAALEQADVVLMHDRLENFLAAHQLSCRARRIIRQNLVLSLGTVVVLVAFAVSGRIPLTLGVLGHEGSTVLVVVNSLRLLVGPKRN
ncbi:MAG: heavy metal translocating P-type ATPase [Limisphaerales bacterium]